MNGNIFKYRDYKEFVRDRVSEMDHNGRGQYRAMAKHMRVHASLLSHVFRGSKDLTSEQACSLADFLGLEVLETDYLVALVEHARAGSTTLGDSIERRLRMLREKQLQIEYRLPTAKPLSAEQQTTFYSQWYFSAVRLATSLEGTASNASVIAARLELPVELVERALAFLVSAGLVTRQGSQYAMATKRTHLAAASPLVSAHHRNWRTKAMSMYDHMDTDDFAFTAAIALAKEDFARVRQLLVECVANAAKLIEPSKCETLALLNVDFLEF